MWARNKCFAQPFFTTALSGTERNQSFSSQDLMTLKQGKIM